MNKPKTSIREEMLAEQVRLLKDNQYLRQKHGELSNLYEKAVDGLVLASKLFDIPESKQDDKWHEGRREVQALAMELCK
jgi:hypothetical protein